MREMDEYQLWASPTCGGVGIQERIGIKDGYIEPSRPWGGGRCGGSRVEKKGLDLDSSERQVDQSYPHTLNASPIRFLPVRNISIIRCKAGSAVLPGS